MKMRFILLTGLMITLTGCAGFQSYDVELVEKPEPPEEASSEDQADTADSGQDQDSEGGGSGEQDLEAQMALCGMLGNCDDLERQQGDESTEAGDGASGDMAKEIAVIAESETREGTIEYFGSSYEGEIVNDKPHGQGKLTYSDGTTYEGEFFQGRFHGEGEVRYSDGRYYKGGIKNETAQGEGKATTPEGMEAEGTFDNGTLVRGTLKKPSGVVLKGGFDNLVLQGEGEMITPAGSRYEGKFNDGRPTGVIVHTKKDGESSYHFWRDNERIFTTVGPNELDGDYKSGCKALRADNSELAVIKGRCSNGLLGTKGVAFDEREGLIYDGRFRNGYLTRGATFRPEGDFRQGSWKKSRPHGKVKVYEDGALVYDGGFRNGTRHGDGVCVVGGDPQKCEYYKGDRSDKLWLHKKLKEDLAELDSQHESRMEQVREDIENQRERFEQQYQSRLDSINRRINNKQVGNAVNTAVDMWVNDQLGAGAQAQADRLAKAEEERRELERERAQMKEDHARESRRREREWEREESRRINELQQEYEEEKKEIIASHRENCTRIPGKEFVRSDLYCVDK